MQSGRSSLHATSNYNRFQNPRPCNHPVRPNSIPHSERALRSVYTKNETLLVDSVNNKTQRPPYQNSKLTYTLNENVLGEGK